MLERSDTRVAMPTVGRRRRARSGGPRRATLPVAARRMCSGAGCELCGNGAPLGWAGARLHPRRRRDLPAVVRDDPRRSRPVAIPGRRRAGGGAVDPHLRSGRRRRSRRLQRRRGRRAHAALRRGRARCCATRRWWRPASPPRGCPPPTKWCRWSPIRARPELAARTRQHPLGGRGGTVGRPARRRGAWRSATRRPHCSSCSN